MFSSGCAAPPFRKPDPNQMLTDTSLNTRRSVRSYEARLGRRSPLPEHRILAVMNVMLRSPGPEIIRRPLFRSPEFLPSRHRIASIKKTVRLKHVVLAPKKKYLFLSMNFVVGLLRKKQNKTTPADISTFDTFRRSASSLLCVSAAAETFITCLAMSHL